MSVLMAFALTFMILWDWRLLRLASTHREHIWRRSRLFASVIGATSAVWLVLHSMGYGPQGQLVYKTLWRLGPFSQSGWIEQPLASTSAALIGVIGALCAVCVASLALLIPRLQRYYTAEAEALLKRAGVPPQLEHPQPGSAHSIRPPHGA